MAPPHRTNYHISILLKTQLINSNQKAQKTLLHQASGEKNIYLPPAMANLTSAIPIKTAHKKISPLHKMLCDNSALKDYCPVPILFLIALGPEATGSLITH